MLRNKRALTLLVLSLFVSVFTVSPALAGESDCAVWSNKPAPAATIEIIPADEEENLPWTNTGGFEVGRVSIPGLLGLTFFEIIAPKYVEDGTEVTLSYTGNGGILPETATVTDGKITGLVVQDVTGTLTITPDGLGPITIPGLAVKSTTTEYRYNSATGKWNHPQWGDRWCN